MNKLLTNATFAADSMERAGMKRLSRRTNIAIIKSVFQYDPLVSLQQYNGPKLIVGIPEEEQPNALHVQMPDVPYKTISGASHWTQIDKPEEFNRILTEFLNAVDAEK